MNGYVKSAQRVLELIEFFAEWRRPATVNEISQSLGYPQSSTSMLLGSLRESGYFDHDPRTGMYVPNVRLAVATSWIQAQMFSEQSLLRLMERILAQCGHTVMIGAQQGVHLRYLHVLQATREDRFIARSGAQRSLFRSAAGKMILTTKIEREMLQLLRRANGLEHDPALRSEPEAVRRDLDKARRDGYAMSMGTSMPGAAALAILLPVPVGHAAMTLSLGGPMREIRRDRERLVRLLRESVADFRRAVMEQASTGR